MMNCDTIDRGFFIVFPFLCGRRFEIGHESTPEVSGYSLNVIARMELTCINDHYRPHARIVGHVGEGDVRVRWKADQGIRRYVGRSIFAVTSRCPDLLMWSNTLLLDDWHYAHV